MPGRVRTVQCQGARVQQTPGRLLCKAVSHDAKARAHSTMPVRSLYKVASCNASLRQHLDLDFTINMRNYFSSAGLSSASNFSISAHSSIFLRRNRWCSDSALARCSVVDPGSFRSMSQSLSRLSSTLNLPVATSNRSRVRSTVSSPRLSERRWSCVPISLATFVSVV